MATEHATNSNLAPWAVASWPEVEYYLPKHRSRWPRFRQGGMSYELQPEGTTQTGSSVWVGEVAGHAVGLAWDWLETRPGVVALIDPNGIMSNLRFLRDEDHFESPAAACVSATRIVHALPWQDHVRLELIRVRDAKRKSNSRVPQPCIDPRDQPTPCLVSPLRAPAVHCRI